VNQQAELERRACRGGSDRFQGDARRRAVTNPLSVLATAADGMYSARAWPVLSGRLLTRTWGAPVPQAVRARSHAGADIQTRRGLIKD